MEQSPLSLITSRRIKNVIILGAGASADAGAPIMNNFWEKTQSLIKQNKFSNSEAKRLKKVISAKDRLLPNSNIEEFFSFVDFQINFDVLIPTPKHVRSIAYSIVNKRSISSIPIISNLKRLDKPMEYFEKLKNEVSFLISRNLDESLKQLRTMYWMFINQ